MDDESIEYVLTSADFETKIEADCVIVWVQKTNHNSQLLAAVIAEQPRRKLPVFKVDIDVLREKVLAYAIRNCPFVTVFRQGFVVEASTKLTSLISVQLSSRTNHDVKTERDFQIGPDDDTKRVPNQGNSADRKSS